LVQTKEENRVMERGLGRIQPYVAGFLYVIGFSVLSVAAMIKTRFNNGLRVALLTVTVLAFFFLDGDI